MKDLDYNQIKIFINLEIMGEEDKNKKKIVSIFTYSNIIYLKHTHTHTHIYIYILKITTLLYYIKDNLLENKLY